jgi:predicted amidohydrolase YtcJ
MAGARHRRPARDLSQPPHGIGQALTPRQALQGLTVNPAWAAGDEHRAGQLAVGYRADLTVLADNPLTVPDADLAALPVLLTVLAGRITHRALPLGRFSRLRRSCAGRGEPVRPGRRSSATRPARR